jgi:small subunit ribosomal protein S21
MIINAQVTVRQGEGELDRALKRLKAKLDTEGVMDTVRAKRAFETPKQQRERKLRNKIRKAKLAQR